MTPTPLERILENFDEKYAHYVNLGPEIGESSTQTEIKMLITHAYKAGEIEGMKYVRDKWRESMDEEIAMLAARGEGK